MKWNEFDTNIKEYFKTLREDRRLFDVILVTDDGQHIQAHKIILSAGSHFFSDIFLKSTPFFYKNKVYKNVQVRIAT